MEPAEAPRSARAASELTHTEQTRRRRRAGGEGAGEGGGHLHDGDVAVVLPALHVEDGGLTVHPQARDVQPRAHQPARVVAQVQDEALRPRALYPPASPMSGHTHAIPAWLHLKIWPPLFVMLVSSTSVGHVGLRGHSKPHCLSTWSCSTGSVAGSSAGGSLKGKGAACCCAWQGERGRAVACLELLHGMLHVQRSVLPKVDEADVAELVPVVVHSRGVHRAELQLLPLQIHLRRKPGSQRSFLH